MSALPSLTILLGDREVGTLAHLPEDRNLFVFNEDYVADNKRPLLSLSFKDAFGQLITDVRPTQTRLPPFFSNLLPEGPMRDYLAARAGVNVEREFYLLWALGDDLPGGVRAVPDGGAELPHRFAGEGDVERRKIHDPVMRFSLAGVQLKFSALQKGTGLTIPVDGAGGGWIVKLPDSRYPGVPENEHAMMTFARQVGIDVPETFLVPLGQIEGLPEGMGESDQQAFAIRRFDRDDHGKRIHMEDFAQVFGVYPYNKYKKASYRNIAHVIWSEIGEEGITEFISRLVFNMLIGNGDMHLKNWSLLYRDGRTPSLAPAYDFLSTIAYIKGDALALTFMDGKAFTGVSMEQFRRFASKVGLPQKMVVDMVQEAVSRFDELWPHAGHFGVSGDIWKAIDTHLQTLPFRS